LSAGAAVRAALGRLKAWLFDDALPLWWERGADPAGGFYDRLDLDGTPMVGPKRLRVQARQAFVYATAAQLGWPGPAEQACRHALGAVRAARQPDGLYRLGPAPAGPPDGMGTLYDQAFVLLGLASAKAAFGDRAAEGEAAALLDRLDAFAETTGGYREAPDLAAPLFPNPNMHLFEGFIAWSEVSDDSRWRERALGQARLAVERLIDPTTHALVEAYGSGWRPLGPPRAQVVWPGHLYEWAWLLLRWPGCHGAYVSAAIDLITAAARGADRRTGVTVFALDGALAVSDARARLWSQTEAIKAFALAAERTGEGVWDSETEAACGALEEFLDVPTPGLWRDWRGEDGRFVEEPAPASSFYHIAGAIAELERIVQGPSNTSAGS
jgi:mannose/cellobiose epimerase-like protein (N-acyl-D-glucosamine 2-epimerase family)